MKMMGSKPISARFSGINNVDIIFKTYILAAMLSAVPACCHSRANSARADYGSSYYHAGDHHLVSAVGLTRTEVSARLRG